MDGSLISQRISSLRKWLSSHNYDALIIPHEDEFLGEYIPEYNERLLWATGFTGSAGVAVITQHKAAIFVDGRYTVQVKKQVPSSIFEYCDFTEKSFLDWLNNNKDSIKTVAYNPTMHSASWLTRTKEQLDEVLHLVEINENPIDQLWLDRPQPKYNQIRLMPYELVGQTSQSKREQVASILKEKKVDAAILTSLDSICWLLNIRGLDIPRLPVILSHAIIHSDSRVDFFLPENRLPKNFNEHVGKNVFVISPNQLTNSIEKLSGKKVLFDPESSSAWFQLLLGKYNVTLIEGSNPCTLLKAVKNQVEIDGMKSSHIKDGVAMVKFLCWLDNEVENDQLHDEAVLSDKLQSFREEEASLVDLSFDTISAAGANAAMCHYHHADQSVPSKLTRNSLYLVDSGGQYFNGTTDITRTVAIGEPTDEMKKQFSLVLKGHISLATALFPAGTTGHQLDVLARQHLWAQGFDYNHGTGHGVGHFLSVHEGPQSISKKTNTVELLPGMVLSNEPGYYRAGCFGIRIENLEQVINKETNGDFNVLGFESLTLCPIDKRNIDTNLLTEQELSWLNSYHMKVLETLSPLLSGKERNWLEKATSPLLSSS